MTPSDPLTEYGLRVVRHPVHATSGTLVYHVSDPRTGKRTRVALDFTRSRVNPPRLALVKKSPGRGTDALTFLHCAPGKTAAKTIIVEPASASSSAATWRYDVQDYDCGTVYVGLIEVEIETVHELAYWLQIAAQDPRSMLIRGEPLPDAMPPLLRRGADSLEHPTFRDVPRRWAMIDLDKAITGDFDLVREPEVAVRAAVALLPPFLQRATCVWQLSGTAWLRGVRLHLFFWFQRNVTNKELCTALKDCPIDRSVFRCVQPHFIANPVFVGASDPLARRWGVHDGGVR